MLSRCLGLLLLLAISMMPAWVHAQERAQKLCGWISNPTPANWWLEDRSGEWLISAQGGYQADGTDRLPDFKNQWVRTNGYYGYGCACLTATVDRKERRIVRIVSGQALPLSTCRNDRSLKRRPD